MRFLRPASPCSPQEGQRAQSEIPVGETVEVQA